MGFGIILGELIAWETLTVQCSTVLRYRNLPSEIICCVAPVGNCWLRVEYSCSAQFQRLRSQYPSGKGLDASPVYLFFN